MRLGAYGALRGHLQRFDEEAWQWLWADTLEPSDADDRPCVRCGKLPTEDGHDSCIANLSGGVVAACCGHGIEPPYVMFDDDTELHDGDAVTFIGKNATRVRF